MGVIHDSGMMSSNMRKGVKTDLPIFRERLHEALKDLDMSQRQLALQMGKDPRTINHVFTGPVHPDLGTLRDLCARLNVSADYLLGLGEKTQPKGGGIIIRHYDSFNAAFQGGEASHIGVTTLPDWEGAEGDIVAFKMSHDNLNHPLIEDGDIVYVDTGVNKVGLSGFYVNEDADGFCWTIYINVSDRVTDGPPRLTRIYFEDTRGVKYGHDARKELDPKHLKIRGRLLAKRTPHFL